MAEPEGRGRTVETTSEGASPERSGHEVSPADVTDPFEQIRESEAQRKAMLARPRLGLRTKVLLGFLVVFLLAAIPAGGIIYSISTVERKIRSLEIVSDYVFEIDAARRYEKNYFLYDTNLRDALESVQTAREILRRNKRELEPVIGSDEWQGIVANIDRYEELLEELREFAGRDEGHQSADEKKDYELRVRKHGQQMVLFAQDLTRKERRAIEAGIAGSLRTQIFSLVFMLLFMITTAYLISGNIVGSIVRFESYAQRIAAGDFTPITPSRRYRDEFTDLGLAINHMMVELRKHEAMLIQAHKMRAIGTLTAGVAHELNNPLNNISITVHMLLEDFEELDDVERKDMLGDVVKEVGRAKKIVSNLLDFTRESETKLEDLDLVRLVEGTISLVGNQIKIAGIKVELSVADDRPSIVGDSQQLQQVFLNLILNAVQASSRGGKIQVLVHPSDEPGHLAVKVIDYGTGIPEHHLHRIFDPFFTTKAKGKGTGLGLSVSRGIVAKHDGRMLVDSKVGRGTVFTVVLPAAETPTPEATSPPEGSHGLP